MAKATEAKVLTGAEAQGEQFVPGEAAAEPKAGPQPAKKKEPAKDTVPYVLPKNILSDAKHQVVVLNGRVYQVQAGVRVEIPKGVAEILDHALAQKEAANELVEDLAK